MKAYDILSDNLTRLDQGLRLGLSMELGLGPIMGLELGL
jgi:hypothetical protein